MIYDDLLKDLYQPAVGVLNGWYSDSSSGWVTWEGLPFRWGLLQSDLRSAAALAQARS